MNSAPQAVITDGPAPSAQDGGARLPVCVIVASCGRPQRARAIRSILSQDYAGYVECLVVFDGGDRSLPEIEPTPVRALWSIDNTRGKGLPAARNAGAMATDCDLIALCDDDDSGCPTSCASRWRP